jgi:hypothetical protein
MHSPQRVSNPRPTCLKYSASFVSKSSNYAFQTHSAILGTGFSSRVGDSDYELVNCGRKFPKSVSSYALTGKVEETSAMARPSNKKSSYSTLLDNLQGS